MKTITDGDHLYAPMWNALMQAFAGTAVISGCVVAPSGAWDTYFSVSAGQVRIGGALVTVAGGNSLLASGVAINRYDLICITAAGAIHAVQGTTAQKCPAIPAGECLIAIVYMPAYATVINSANVYDARLLATDLVAGGIDVGNIAGSQFSITASDTEIIAATYGAETKNSPIDGTYGLMQTVVVPTRYGADSEVRISTTVTVHKDPNNVSAAVDIRVNSVSVAEHVLPYSYPSTTTTNTDDITVGPGDIVTIWLRGLYYDEGYYYSAAYLTALSICGEDPFRAWAIP